MREKESDFSARHIQLTNREKEKDNWIITIFILWISHNYRMFIKLLFFNKNISDQSLVWILPKFYQPFSKWLKLYMISASKSKPTKINAIVSIFETLDNKTKYLLVCCINWLNCSQTLSAHYSFFWRTLTCTFEICVNEEYSKMMLKKSNIFVE